MGGAHGKRLEVLTPGTPERIPGLCGRCQHQTIAKVPLFILGVEGPRIIGYITCCDDCGPVTEEAKELP